MTREEVIAIAKRGGWVPGAIVRLFGVDVAVVYLSDTSDGEGCWVASTNYRAREGGPGRYRGRPTVDCVAWDEVTYVTTHLREHDFAPDADWPLCWNCGEAQGSEAGTGPCSGQWRDRAAKRRKPHESGLPWCTHCDGTGFDGRCPKCGGDGVALVKPA